MTKLYQREGAEFVSQTVIKDLDTVAVVKYKYFARYADIQSVSSSEVESF